MFKRMTLLCGLILLSGCASQALDDMLDNKFVSIEAKPAPEEMQGLWTGNIATYLITYKVDADGSGTQCISPNNTSSPLSKIKYRDGEILNQGGTKLIIQSSGSNTMTLESPYFGGGSYEFFRDDDLEKAAIECRKALTDLDA